MALSLHPAQCDGVPMPSSEVPVCPL